MNATRFLSIPDSELDRIIFQVARFRGPRTDTGCIPWTGRMDRYGYGRVTLRNLDGLKKVDTGAHRVFWVIEHGPIADPRSVIDHLCRTRECVNTKHMELVSNRENTVRGATSLANREKLGLPERRKNQRRSGRKRTDRTHCAHGHAWTPENVYVRVTKEGYESRTCRECNRQRMREWSSRQIA